MPFEQRTDTAMDMRARNEVTVMGNLDVNLPQTVLHLGTGDTVVVPTEILLGYAAHQGTVPVSAVASRTAEEDVVIPLVAEQLQVGKQTVTTGKVKLHRDVETFTDTVALPLTRTTWDVERTPIGQAFAEKPEVRQEGDVMVFPLVEERLVAKREYFLIEEVRVRQVAITAERSASFELKRDVLTVERE